MEHARLDLSDDSVARVVIALQRRAYQVEADLIGTDAIPPLMESLDELRRSDETFLGVFVSGVLAGVVSWKRDAHTLDIHRLAVDPACFRRGIGAELVRLAQAAEPDAERVIVQTGAANEPAKTLYRREGFVEIGEREAAPGLRVTLFEKRRRRDG